MLRLALAPLISWPAAPVLLAFFPMRICAVRLPRPLLLAPRMPRSSSVSPPTGDFWKLLLWPLPELFDALSNCIAKLISHRRRPIKKQTCMHGSPFLQKEALLQQDNALHVCQHPHSGLRRWNQGRQCACLALQICRPSASEARTNNRGTKRRETF